MGEKRGRVGEKRREEQRRSERKERREKRGGKEVEKRNSLPTREYLTGLPAISGSEK